MKPRTESSEGRSSTSPLPTVDQLSRRDRAMVGVTAGADYLLRTGAASLVAGTVMPLSMGRTVAARERANLGFYAELAAAHDSAVSFPPPTSMPPVRRQPANRMARAITNGPVDALSFDSPFQTVNPAFRETWRRHDRNGVAHAQHWRHADGPRPTLCVIHGFMASPYWLNGLFLQLPRFYRAGMDVLLYTLPFHGARAARSAPFSGHGYFAHGFTGFAEAMAHAIHDLRIFLNYLESTGVERIGVSGISLGGYTSSLLASVDSRIQVVIPNAPVVDVGDLLSAWFPASMLLGVGLSLGGIDRDLVEGSLAYSSPLNYRPLVPTPRRLIITGLGDRLAPPEQAEKLWRHWDECAMTWYPGNHVVHLDQPAYLQLMAQFLRDNDFAPDTRRKRTA